MESDKDLDYRGIIAGVDKDLVIFCKSCVSGVDSELFELIDRIKGKSVNIPKVL
ncbi:hypothetical protein ACJJIF_15070 [Microbulbifer sp. SSSA002]|uniref:hypothetical protein n=1 Tax=Microbulbifer sp. SSSA002 TaxID=3243376 RepID=UPI004039278D